jgi:hypothetical protein
MRKKLLTYFTLSFISVLCIATPVNAQSLYTSGTKGLDVSWPNCSAAIHINKVDFGIVGVSDGLGYSQNPCLANEASHFNSPSLYVNTGWYAQSSHINPSSPKKCKLTDEDCLAYNYGYNAGLYALSYANSLGLKSNTWWLDVESDNTWSAHTTQNRNSLKGEYAALANAGVQKIGAYSTTDQWDSITGNWLNNWPSWGSTTWKTAKQAQTYCTGHNFTGGNSILMQYLPNNSSLDHDVAC